MRVTLSGIVKNESKIIERCLDSCKGIVDYIAITDTGSTDNTPNIIEDWCKRNNIPCNVVRSKWVNFSHSRTEALRNSENAFPDTDYLLLLDADMILENHGFKKDSLTEDAYYLEQYNPGIRYSNVRLVSTKRKWFYVGVTHEYITSSDNYNAIDLHELKIYDIGDGGSKSDKYTRDIKLLSDELKKKDLNEDIRSRYTFYLAQSYYDTKQYSKALRYYRERTQLNGYDMEVWYAMYKMGLCLKELDRWDEAEIQLLNAYSMKSYRCEPLTEIMNHHALKPKPDYPRAGLYMHKLLKLRDLPNMDPLFNIAYYKDYYIDYLISIVAYYVDENEMGLKSCNRVLSSNAPEYIKQLTMSNIKFYQE